MCLCVCVLVCLCVCVFSFLQCFRSIVFLRARVCFVLGVLLTCFWSASRVEVSPVGRRMRWEGGRLSFLSCPPNVLMPMPSSMPMLMPMPMPCPPVSMSQGSRVAFSNLHYHVYLRTGSKRKGGDGGGGGGDSGDSGNSGGMPAPGPGGGRGRRREAHVLRGVTGVVSPGQIMAIMGEQFNEC